MLSILILGSAAGGGFPQWNCNCENCRRVRAGDPTTPARTQSSVAVSADGEHWFLLNASPDARQQIERTPRLHPRGGARHSPIVGVVLTNADVDHVAGLLTLREGQTLSVYATGRVHQALAANPIFGVLDPERVLPAVRFAVEAYVRFVGERSPLEAIASSLTELFAPAVHRERISGMLANYDFIGDEVMSYFRTRLTQAPSDVAFALDYVKREARTAELQRLVIDALRFKCDVLWAQLDAVHHAYVQPGLVPPGAFVPDETR